MCIEAQRTVRSKLKLVILEDRLLNVVGYAGGLIDKGIDIFKVYIYQSNKERFEADKDKYKERLEKLDLYQKIEPVDELNFEDKLDICYYENIEDKIESEIIFLFDVIVQEEAKLMAFNDRINIRYATKRNKERFFFYTASDAIVNQITDVFSINQHIPVTMEDIDGIGKMVLNVNENNFFCQTMFESFQINVV